MKITVRVDGERYEVQVGNLYERPVIATVEGVQFEVWPEGEAPFHPNPSARQEPIPPAIPANAANGLTADQVCAPIPGSIFLLKVTPGDQVIAGQDLLILEAMKMKNVIRAPRTGKIATVPVENGQQVAAGDVLVVFKA
jgi:biotin carboxyl carrier protein